MKTKNEDIIRKLFESKCSLSPEERAALNNYEYVNDTFHRQWEEMSEEAVDLVREEKILNGIMKKVRGRRFPFIKKSFYKYGMAAMIAVCMVLSALLLMKNSGEEIIYVVNTGYQSMDSVRLADGTKVMLNAGSRLTYPKEFSGEKREVQLSGQAFFEVTPDKTHPFVVKTQKMDVTVLGTSFEVFSYDGDEEGETVLLTGKVKVEVLESNQQKGGSYVLKPNEKLTYSKTDGISLTTIDADAYSSWRQGKRMSFKNETLEMILERLEKWYGQKIECAPHIARHYRFTFTMHSESLDLILNYIFIKLCGYQAAAYTTFFCYALFCFIHYMFYKKVCTEILNGTQLYDVKGLLAISVGVMFSGVVITFINRLLWLKYTILVVVLVALIINRKRVFSALKSVLGK